MNSSKMFKKLGIAGANQTAGTEQKTPAPLTMELRARPPAAAASASASGHKPSRDTDLKKLVKDPPNTFRFSTVVSKFDAPLKTAGIIFEKRKGLDDINLYKLKASNYVSTLDHLDKCHQFADSGVLQFVKFMAMTYVNQANKFSALQFASISKLILATSGEDAAKIFSSAYEHLQKNPRAVSAFFNSLRHVISQGGNNLRAGDMFSNEKATSEWFDPRLKQDGKLHETAVNIISAAEDVIKVFGMSERAKEYIRPAIIGDKFLSSDRPFDSYIDKTLGTHRNEQPNLLRIGILSELQSLRNEDGTDTWDHPALDSLIEDVAYKPAKELLSATKVEAEEDEAVENMASGKDKDEEEDLSDIEMDDAATKSTPRL